MFPPHETNRNETVKSKINRKNIYTNLNRNPLNFKQANYRENQ